MRAALLRTSLSRGLVLVAIAVAIVRATPNAGTIALQSLLATTTLAHGVPIGAASLGWLGALASYAAWRTAPVALALVTIAFAFGALALVERRARTLGAGDASALAVPLVALCTIDALQSGAGAVTWFFAALAMVVLDAPATRRNPVVFGALTILWCNVEPQGLLAPVLALAVALGASLTPTPGDDPRVRWIAALVAALATLCTPAGPAFPLAAVDALRLGDVATGILATAPAATTPHAYRFGLFVLLAGACAIGSGVRARDALPSACGFVLALASGAFVPVFGVIVAPAIVAGLRAVRVRAFVPAALATIAIAAIAVAVRDAPPNALARQTYELAERAATVAPRATLLCANVEWCDAAVASGGRVVMDGRIATAGARERELQRRVVAVGHGWKDALARSGATRVLARNDSSLDTLLGMSSGWHEIARDDRATLFARTAIAAARTP